MKHRGLLFLAIPATGAALLAMGLLLGQSSDTPPRRPIHAQTVPPVHDSASVRLKTPSPQPSKLLAPMPADEAAKAAEEGRIRTTYENYWTAVAIGNQPLQKALLAVLQRDRSTAIRIAEAQLTTAGEERELEIARKTLDALRRTP